MLTIQDLQVTLQDKTILHDIHLTIPAGELHLLMGPNGHGKSTLASLLAGHPAYQAAEGRVTFCEKDLLTMPAAARAHHGLFVSFQQPIAIPGVSMIQFLKTALAQQAAAHGTTPPSVPDLLRMAKAKAAYVGLPEAFLHRPLHVGFSGGEKKRSELLQLLLLKPRLAVLDEIDSGLDRAGLQHLQVLLASQRTSGKSCLLITHYSELLDRLQPDRVHMLQEGRLVASCSAREAAKWLKHNKK